MLTRRSLFGFAGIGSLGAIAPLATSMLFDPGRRITHLPDGGMLIEDQSFRTGIALQNAHHITLEKCTVSGFDIGMHFS
jgi:hypothetical protein